MLWTEHVKVKNGSFNIVDVYNMEITDFFPLQTFLKYIKTLLMWSCSYMGDGSPKKRAFCV